MSVTGDGTGLEELVVRLAELERANAQMKKELESLQVVQIAGQGKTQHLTQEIPSKQVEGSKKPITSQKRRSRRTLIRRGIGAAVATVGAGALLEINGGSALANSEVTTKGPTIFNNNGSNSPAVAANSTSSSGQQVNAIKATSTNYTGIAGYTNSSDIRSSGIFGQGLTVGIAGQVTGATTAPVEKVGVYGTGSNRSNTTPLGGAGVVGESDTYYGVSGLSIDSTGNSPNAMGVAGFSNTGNYYTTAGVLGGGPNGVIGQTVGATTTPGGYIGVYGTASNGSSLGGIGVYGEGDTGYGVYGYCPATDGWGVAGVGDTIGVYATADGNSMPGDGVYSFGDNTGVSAYSNLGTALYGIGNVGLYSSGNPSAGEFSGDVDVSGNLTKGGGSFKIDHPLDPANKFLFHSFVESPDMKNVYDGVVTLDANGEASVALPGWFEALNNDFRYQLTPVGTPGPNLYVAAEIANLSFKIAGGTAGMKVSWQVTGIRQDVWANAHRIPVELDKPAKEQGLYLHPELYGHPSAVSIMDAPYANKKKRSKKIRTHK